MENEIIPSLKETIFRNVSGIASDVSEVAIDAFLENELIKQIPIVGTLTKCGKFALSIRDRQLLKKIFIFTQELNRGSLNEEEIIAYGKRLERDDKKLNQEMEFILIILDKYIENEKSKHFARLYISYIKGNVDWEEMMSFADIINRILICDFKELRMIYNKYSYSENETVNTAAMSRLNSLGLVQYFNGMVVSISRNSISGEDKAIRARISCEGKAFCESVNI